MNKAKQMTTDLFKQAKTQTNITNVNVSNVTNSTAQQTPAVVAPVHHDHSLLEAAKDIVISDPHKAVAVPQAMDVTMNKPSETLPVYTQKKWVANKEELDEENLKNGPSFAKISAPKHTNVSFTVLPDQHPTLMLQVDNELKNLKKSVKSTFAVKPKNEMEAVKL